MRIVSILLAGVVVLALYVFVFERERLMSFAAGDRGAFRSMGLPDAQGAAEAEAVAAAAVGVAEPDGAAPAGRVAVVALQSAARSIESVVMVRGQTEAAREVEARAETSGLVISEPLRRGASVEAGQLLCRLDPGARANALAEAEARLAEARARLPEAEARVPEAAARAKEAEARVAEARARLREAEINQNAASRLSEGGYASDTQVAGAEATLESARAGVVAAEAGLDGAASQIEGAEASVKGASAGIESAEAAVAAARQELGKLEIRAPFAGILETDTAELGALLQPGGLCATVIRLDPIKLVGFVPETEVDRVRVGAPAGARLATGREVQGEVTFLSRAADPTTRTFRVEVEVPNADLTIRDGQTAEIVIAGGGEMAHLLPQSALTLDDDGRLGYRVVEDGRAAFAPVEILRDTAEGVWVTGLPEAAEVIVVGQEFVSGGVPVEVTPAGAGRARGRARGRRRAAGARTGAEARG